jgi:hypothetical protein
MTRPTAAAIDSRFTRVARRARPFDQFIVWPARVAQIEHTGGQVTVAPSQRQQSNIDWQPYLHGGYTGEIRIVSGAVADSKPQGAKAIVKCHARLYDLRVKDHSSAEVKAPGFSVAPVVVIRGAAHCAQSHRMRGLSARWPQVRQ